MIRTEKGLSNLYKCLSYLGSYQVSNRTVQSLRMFAPISTLIKVSEPRTVQTSYEIGQFYLTLLIENVKKDCPISYEWLDSSIWHFDKNRQIEQLKHSYEIGQFYFDTYDKNLNRTLQSYMRLDSSIWHFW